MDETLLPVLNKLIMSLVLQFERVVSYDLTVASSFPERTTKTTDVLTAYCVHPLTDHHEVEPVYGPCVPGKY